MHEYFRENRLAQHDQNRAKVIGPKVMPKLSQLVFLLLVFQITLLSYWSFEHSITFSKTSNSSFNYSSGYNVKDQSSIDDSFDHFDDNEGDIAVCVSGQVARWQPFHLVNGLLNANPRFRFHIFFNIQSQPNRSDIVYNTDQNNVFDPGYMTHLAYDDAWTLVSSLLNSNHSKVVSMVFIQPATTKEWKEMLKVDVLDRITQFVDTQTTILNMYAHQPRCVEQLLAYERERNSRNPAVKFRFDYVISTREDVYFFRPMNLTHLTSTLRTPGSAKRYGQDREDACDIPFKRCLNFWGFNMRFFILQRDKAVRFLGNRLSFYSFMYATNKTIENPERFELAMANALQLTPCPMPVDEYPVTAARYFGQGQYCFISFEVQNCVPKYAESFIRQHLCTDYRRRIYLQHVYTESKHRLKHNFTLGSMSSSYGLNLTEGFKPLKIAEVNKNAEPSFPFHSENATRNLEIVRDLAKASLLFLSRDFLFINRTWQPEY